MYSFVVVGVVAANVLGFSAVLRRLGEPNKYFV
jgi:hypothetical protein